MSDLNNFKKMFNNATRFEVSGTNYTWDTKSDVMYHSLLSDEGIVEIQAVLLRVHGWFDEHLYALFNSNSGKLILMECCAGSHYASIEDGEYDA